MSKENPFVWYELMTADVGAAKAFYGDVIGWSTHDIPVGEMTYSLINYGERQVGGMMAMPPAILAAGMKPCWMAHVGVEDVDAAAAKVARLGGEIKRQPTDIPGVGRFAVLADRQGAGFLMFKPSKPGNRAVSREPGDIGWHELHTTDAANAFEFYSAMFGWGKGSSVDMGAIGIYQLFTIDGVDSGGMFNSPAAKGGCFWLYYLNVGDIDAAVKRVEKGGGKMLNGPQQVPGGGWVAQAVDPQGAMFAMLGMRK